MLYLLLTNSPVRIPEVEQAIAQTLLRMPICGVIKE